MFLTAARIDAPLTGVEPYVADLPAVRALQEWPLRFTRPVTVITGDNGAGKSTLVEALAVAMRINPSGGSRHVRFGREDAVSSLYRSITVTRALNPEDAFFLRGETMFTMAGFYEALGQPPGSIKMDDFLHMSHGQSLMTLVQRRFGAGGLFILDEPEAGLSILRQLELLGKLHHLAGKGSQIIMATHSPVLMAIPGAQLLQVSDDGITEVDFEDCEAVQAAREFVADPRGTAGYLVGDE
ncbi:AAA family ATPase [Corynebacterium pacaense]|uniref:AAA family ATPase n=1 Tax=Corynebacterium pacaense TaxID=1816684 RepID=UPI0009B96524|nr:AAA family ATPase [Corynebacterium pacaense]